MHRRKGALNISSIRDTSVTTLILKPEIIKVKNTRFMRSHGVCIEKKRTMVGVSMDKVSIIKRSKTRTPSRVSEETIKPCIVMGKTNLTITPSEIRIDKTQIKKLIRRCKI